MYGYRNNYRMLLYCLSSKKSLWLFEFSFNFSDSIAITWMNRVFPSTQWAISLGISVSLMNTISCGILSASRIFYCASQDGKLPFIYSMLNEHHCPVVAVFMIIILSSISIITSNLIYLVKYVGLGAWCINLMNMIGLLKIRYQKPDLPRPYKVSQYAKNVEYIVCLLLNLSQ